MSHNEEKQTPDYTPVPLPLPLPDPNSLEYAEATAKPRVPLRVRFLRCLTVLILLGVSGAAGVAWHYWQKASILDLSKVAFVEQGSLVLDREGDVMGRVFSLDRLPVEINELPGHFIDALIATEDSRFFEHPGFDPAGILRAALTNFRAGDIREGASTITQQLARQCYGLRGRTIDRKLTEIMLSMRIESAYSKHEILEHYLNYIYFGSGHWGVGAAARGYFSKSVSELTIAESALLCGIIKSPSTYSPHVHPEIAISERNQTVRKMTELALLDPTTAASVVAEEIELTAPEEVEKRPQFLLARIQKELRAIAAEHDLPLENLLVETSVDSYLQRAAAGHLERGLTAVERHPDYPHQSYADYRSENGRPKPGKAPPYLQGAAIVIHNGTGEVLAAIGGRDFGDSEYNRAFDARRPPGSAFAPLVYAAAFEEPQIDLTTELTDAPMDNRQVMVGGTAGVLGEWGRESFAARYEGQVSAALALLDSRNAATVELANRTGLEKIQALTRRAGIASPLRDYPSTFLGQSVLTLAELAHAYTMLPNLGTRAPQLRMVTRIHGPEGELLYEAPPSPQMQPVISELTAAQLNGILHASFYIGSNRSAYQSLGLEQASVAGKGGTTHGFTDGWFVGYNNVVTCAVWVGFDTPREIHPKAFSRNIALPIWVDLMSALPEAPLATPAKAKAMSVCLRTGLPAGPDCVDAFADGKPYSTGVTLPLPSLAEEQAPCRHHPGGHASFEAASFAQAAAAAGTPSASKEPEESGKKAPNRDPGTPAEIADTSKAKPKPAPEPVVIRSRSPLVIGPDPYAS